MGDATGTNATASAMATMSAGHLVLVTTSFPIRGDGSEAAGSFVADLAEALAEHTSVRVVAPGTCAAREVWSERVEIFRYSAPPFPLSTLRPWRPKHLLWLLRILREGSAATREAAVGAQHLFALWGIPCGEWARRAAKANAIEYSVWLLGSDVWTLGRTPYLRQCLARVVRQAKHAYADGYRLADDAKRIASCDVDFLPSTRRIEPSNPSPPRCAPPYRLLFLGRWHLNKGVDLFLDALALLSDEDWRFIESVEIQGGGPLDALVRERVAALRLAGRPVKAGQFLAKSDAEAAIVRADWIVIPSRIESIPVVFSDAIKSGRPVIATPVGDLPRLVKADPACGVLAEAANSPAIAAALRAVVSDDSTRHLAGVGKQAAEFALPAIAQRLLQEFAHG